VFTGVLLFQRHSAAPIVTPISLQFPEKERRPYQCYSVRIGSDHREKIPSLSTSEARWFESKIGRCHSKAYALNLDGYVEKAKTRIVVIAQQPDEPFKNLFGCIRCLQGSESGPDYVTTDDVEYRPTRRERQWPQLAWRLRGSRHASRDPASA